MFEETELLIPKDSTVLFVPCMGICQKEEKLSIIVSLPQLTSSKREILFNSLVISAFLAFSSSKRDLSSALTSIPEDQLGEPSFAY